MASPEKPHKTIDKKVILGTAVGIFVIISFIIIGTRSSEDSQTDVQTSQVPVEADEPQPKLISSPLPAMLPTRQDLGTEWVIDPIVSPNPYWEDEGRVFNAQYPWSGADVVAEYYDQPDVISVVEQVFHKYGNFKDTTVAVLLVKFDSILGATGIFFDRIEQLEESGGYTEIRTYYIDAVCYGLFIDRNEKGEATRIFCYKDNIYFDIVATSEHLFPETEDTAINFGKIIGQKLENVERTDKLEKERIIRQVGGSSYSDDSNDKTDFNERSEESITDGNNAVVHVEPESGGNADLTVMTDRTSYQSGDSITITGMLNTTDVNRTIRIEVFSPQGERVRLDTVDASYDGSYSYTFGLVGMTYYEGTYTVRITHGNIMTETTFYFK